MKHDTAARLLLGNWRAMTRIDSLPEAVTPHDRAGGYRIAAAVARLSRQKTAGWKIAATSEAGQRHINVDGPLAGRILRDRLLAPGAKVPIGGNIMRVAEAEFAFGFGAALPPRVKPYTLNESMDAVASLHLAIEVPDSRYTDFTKVGAAQLIADTACASWLVLGPAIDAGWRGLDLAAHGVSGFRNGEKIAQGTGKAVLGGPCLALAWFVNEAARYCGGVEAGQFVTTGTCVAPIAISPDDTIRMDYGSLGTIEARIA